MREIAPALTVQTTADTASVTDIVVTDTVSVTLVDSNQHVLEITFFKVITTYSPFLQINFKLSYFHILEIHCERQH